MADLTAVVNYLVEDDVLKARFIKAMQGRGWTIHRGPCVPVEALESLRENIRVSDWRSSTVLGLIDDALAVVEHG